jgi:glycosyltransferase involved in cell wall biosynthesis
MFGVFEPLKGFEFAIQSLPLLKNHLKRHAKSPAFTFVLAGLLNDNHKWYLAKLQKLVKKLSPAGLRNSVRFMTNVDETVKRDLYEMADVFLYTPVAEPFGITLAEALARGKICVATDCEGPRYVLDCDRPFSTAYSVCGNGILVRNEFSRRCEHISEALVHALTHREELKHVAENGRRFALRSLSWRQLIDSKTTLYKTVMEETTKGARA